MKNFVKFIPVALGLLTLASCSDNDLFGDQAFDQSQLKEGEMLVTMEEPTEYGTAFTRSYTDRTMKKHRWTETTDQLMVYGKAFGAYDLYAFSWKAQGEGTVGVFKRQHQTSNIDDAKWALFPLKSVKDGRWELIDNYNNNTEVTINLPKFVEYGAAYDVPNYATDKDPYYLDELPRWGEITGTENGEALQTNLKYMTAILRLQLAGVPTYANGIKIQMFENANETQPLVLNGDFRTRIAANNEMVEGAALVADKEIAHAGSQYAVDADEDGAIYVHIPATTALNPDDSRRAVLYIPLPAWSVESSIAISIATNYGGENAENIPALLPAPGIIDPTDYAVADYEHANWAPYKTLSKKPIERGKVYGNGTEYNLALDGTDPSAVSDALDLMEVPVDAETIKLVANDPIEVCANGNATTIKVPNKKDANGNPVENIIIDLSNGLYGCDATQTLKVVYKQDSDPFEGNVILIAGKQDVADMQKAVALDVNLPKSGFALVAAQNNSAEDYAKVIKQDAEGAIDIDAEEFVVGNTDRFTPTSLAVTPLKFSPNVKTFTIAKEGRLTGVGIGIDQKTNSNQEDWTFGGVTTINVNGVVDGYIDATTNTLASTEVAVKINGEEIENNTWGSGYATGGDYAAPYVGAISTRGTVEINAGKYVKSGSADNRLAHVNGDIIATKAITAEGNTNITGAVASTGATVALKGHVSGISNSVIPGVTGEVAIFAEGNINISEQAFTPAGNILSNTGDITINNNFNEKDGELTAWIHTGTITATEGSVSLNQGENKIKKEYVVAAHNGNITAGQDFTITGVTTTNGDIKLQGKATINVHPQDGNCVAVGGSLAYELGEGEYELDLLQGYVKALDATEGEVALTFATTPAYAALVGVIKPENVIPTNASIWNGDFEIEKCEGFATYAIDGNRIWTATQLGYMLTTPQYDVQLRSNIDLNNEEWQGISALDAVVFTGLIDATKADAYYQTKTISNLNLVNNPNSGNKQAGFFASATNLDLSNINFDKVKTTFDMVSSTPMSDALNAPIINMYGIGTVAGYAAKARLTRVNVTLTGAKFGDDPEGNENYLSVGIGGLIGVAGPANAALTALEDADIIELNGVTVTATGTPLSGWFGIGGFVGIANKTIKIGMADAVAKLKAAKSNVTGLAINVTNVNTAQENDLYQGMTGQFIGASRGHVDISDIATTLVNAPLNVTGANEAKAFEITNIGTFNRHFFGRGAQTLVGHDGLYSDNAMIYKINNAKYQIYMEMKEPSTYVPGTPHFYDLTIELHQQGQILP